MTKDEFRPIVKKLKIAYRRDGFFSDEDMIDLWYERLGKAEPEYLAKAVDNYIDKNSFQPTIADIIAEYKAIKDGISAVNARLREIYDRTRGVYPNIRLNDSEEEKKAAELDARNAWTALIMQKPLHERIAFAERVEQTTIKYVKMIEDNGRNDIPTLAEFFRGAR